MDDTAEAQAYLEEINVILREKLSPEDEEEIFAEFEISETQLAVQDIPEVPITAPTMEVGEKFDLPDVSTKAPAANITVDDDSETGTKKRVLEDPLGA